MLVCRSILKHAIISPDDGAKQFFAFFVNDKRLSRIWQGIMGTFRAGLDISAGNALLEVMSSAAARLDPATRTIESGDWLPVQGELNDHGAPLARLPLT